MIYPAIFREALSGRLKIKSIRGAYYFCTGKGRFVKDIKGDEGSVEIVKERELVRKLFDLIYKGLFPMNKESCDYCFMNRLCPPKNNLTAEGAVAEYQAVIKEWTNEE